MRKDKNKLKFIFINGALFYGLPMFIIMSFVTDNIFKHGFSFLILGINLFIWIGAGLLFGLVTWSIHGQLNKIASKPKPFSNEQIFRSECRLVIVILNILLSPVLVLGPFVMVAYSYVNSGFDNSIIKWILLCFFSAFIGYHMSQNYHWVEIRGVNIIAKRFWTRKIVEHPISEIKEIKGNRIFFNNSDVIALIKYDMTNVDNFIKTLKEQI